MCRKRAWGFLVTALAAGIGVGQRGRRARISGDHIELGLVPVGRALMGVFSIALGLTHSLHVGAGWLAGVGFAGGLFAVPLNAFLQEKAGAQEKGRILTTNNFANMLGVIAASGLLLAAARQAGLERGRNHARARDRDRSPGRHRGARLADARADGPVHPLVHRECLSASMWKAAKISRARAERCWWPTTYPMRMRFWSAAPRRASSAFLMWQPIFDNRLFRVFFEACTPFPSRSIRPRTPSAPCVPRRLNSKAANWWPSFRKGKFLIRAICSV